jgi:prefoldin subunit 5
MTVKSSVSVIRISALTAAATFSLFALSGHAHAADAYNQNSARSNHAGALQIEFVDQDSDNDVVVDELSTKMSELQTLLSSITEQLAQAEALQLQISELEAQLSAGSGGGAGKVSFQDLHFIEDAATEFEQRVLADSGGALSVDLQLTLDALQAQLNEQASSASPEDMAAFSSSVEELSSSLSSLRSSITEVQTALDGSLDSAIKAGYNVKSNTKI